MNEMTATTPPQTSAEEPQWSTADRLDTLHYLLAETMEVLPARHRKLVQALAKTGDINDARKAAGYVPGNKLPPSAEKSVAFRHAVRMARKIAQLEAGIDAAYKRLKLVEIIEASTTEDRWQPTAAIQGLRLLGEMDGDIKQASGGSPSQVTVVVNTGIDRGVTIEGQVVDDEDSGDE